MYHFIISFLFLSLLSVLGLQAQTNDIKVLSREVLISHRDSLERARIRVITPKKKTRNANKYYYWFYSGRINCNQGLYNENPLTSHYFVYNKEKQLITKGFFNNGKKCKKWMYWYADGTLKRSECWKNGYQTGKTKTFNKKGIKTATLQFKRGLLQGKQKYYRNDSIFFNRFKKGKEIVSKAKTVKLKDSISLKVKLWDRLFPKRKDKNQEKQAPPEMQKNSASLRQQQTTQQNNNARNANPGQYQSTSNANVQKPIEGDKEQNKHKLTKEEKAVKKIIKQKERFEKKKKKALEKELKKKKEEEEKTKAQK